MLKLDLQFFADGGFVEEPTSKTLVKGVWKLNEMIEMGVVSETVNFSTNGKSSDMIEVECTVDMPGVYRATVFYNGIGTVFDSEANPPWTNEYYRTIDFGTEGQSVSYLFYNWLTANAVQIQQVDLPTVTGVWVFNDTLVQSTFNCVWQDITYTCNGVTYLAMVDDGDSNSNYIGYSYKTESNCQSGADIVWAYTGTWTAESYKTIDFGTEGQAVGSNFYNWLTANATQVESEEETTPTTVTYNGNTLASLESGQTATLHCNGKIMKSDVVIAFGTNGTITYHGSITEVESGKTATMPCSGQVMNDDVVIAVPQNIGGTGNLISFTIDGTEYTAEEGMTWGEWVESGYNTDGFFLDQYSADTYVVLNQFNSGICYDNIEWKLVFATELPIADHAYFLD